MLDISKDPPNFGFEQEFQIGGRRVGGGAPCLVIAEIGPNHNGDPEIARRLIEEAAAAGADGVKFQYRRAEFELFDRASASYYYAEPRHEFINRVQTFPHETHRSLREHARRAGILYFCSAMSEEAVACIADLGADALKIPSGEVSNPWLLERASATGLPVIASSGMSPQAEIDGMMSALAATCKWVVLLHCVSEYPTALEDMHLRVISAHRERFGCPVGLSDHSRRLQEVAASVALGAAMIEVHFTFDRQATGPDHLISLLPDELAKLVRQVRDLEAALGRPNKVLGTHATDMRRTFTNSIVTRRAVKAGETWSRETLALKKPGTGMPPDRLPEVLGRRAARALPADTALTPDDIA